MNNISDKNVLIIIIITVLVVFAFIFSVKSPERKIIDSQLMWKEDFSTIYNNTSQLIGFKDIFNMKIYQTNNLRLL